MGSGVSGAVFTLSKLVWLLLEPSNVLVFLCLGGVMLTATRFHRAGRWLAMVSLAGIMFAGFSPFGTWLMRGLEAGYPPLRDEGRVDGIVVLGGALVPDVSFARGQFSINEAGERLTALAGLARRHPEARIVFTGGSGDLTGAGVPEADVVEAMIGDLLPGRAIVYERASRNTRENALFSHRLAAPQAGQRWLLVTSAWHMPRALGLFRKVGWAVTPFPVDYRSTGDGADWRFNRSISLGLRRTDVAAKEWAGLLFALLSGQSDDFRPAP